MARLMRRGGDARCPAEGTRRWWESTRTAAILSMLALAAALPCAELGAQAAAVPAGDSASRAGADSAVVAAPRAEEEESQPLFGRRDALIAGAFALGTIAMLPADRHFALELQNPRTQANKFFKNASKGVEVIASPGAYVIGGTLYLVGRIGGFERVADLGWHGTEAVLLAEGIGYLLKGAVGRARPYVSGASNPDDFRFGGGFRTTDRRSFPSGHSYTAFAAAAAVT
ncbi:MAG TPA: phosphatase PAP2 family protein, partial [Gemmatimonadaceae bacterium]|nr:phosphatase PAP2 family protein [Gemmatimonadaceae bacterium]